MPHPDADLRLTLAQGLMAFPLTDFSPSGRFEAEPYARRVAWMAEHDVSALFLAGGAGEFYALAPEEYREILRAAASVKARRPLLASIGFNAPLAIQYAREAEATNADGLLLLPPYLAEVSADGLLGYVEAVCAATALPVVYYSRANGRMTADVLARACERCSNLIGLKDGVGDFEDLLRMQTLVGDRVTLINGMPTAEIFAWAYAGMGVKSYSSAIFNFAPNAALAFSRAVAAGDRSAVEDFTRDFLLPYNAIRRRAPGYAVALPKAGADLVGRGAGACRPPISDLSERDRTDLRRLLDQLGV